MSHHFYRSCSCKLYGGSLKFEFHATKTGAHPGNTNIASEHPLPPTISKLKATLRKSKNGSFSEKPRIFMTLIFCVGKHHLTDFPWLCCWTHIHQAASPVQGQTEPRVWFETSPGCWASAGPISPNGKTQAGTKVQLLFIGSTKVKKQDGAPVR